MVKTNDNYNFIQEKHKIYEKQCVFTFVKNIR